MDFSLAQIREAIDTFLFQRTRLLNLYLAQDSGYYEGRLLPHRIRGWETINGDFRYELEVFSEGYVIEGY